MKSASTRVCWCCLTHQLSARPSNSNQGVLLAVCPGRFSRTCCSSGRKHTGLSRMDLLDLVAAGGVHALCYATHHCVNTSTRLRYTSCRQVHVRKWGAFWPINHRCAAAYSNQATRQRVTLKPTMPLPERNTGTVGQVREGRQTWVLAPVAKT